MRFPAPHLAAKRGTDQAGSTPARRPDRLAHHPMETPVNTITDGDLILWAGNLVAALFLITAATLTVAIFRGPRR